MSRDGLQNLFEAQLRVARENGEFDHLPGHGKPLQLEELDSLTSDQRFDVLLMRSSGEVSARVQLIREIRACRALINGSDSEIDRERASVAIREKVEELRLLLLEQHSLREP